MTLAEKIAVAAGQAQHNEAAAYAMLECILRERHWPKWLQDYAEKAAATIDAPAATKDRPINT